MEATQATISSAVRGNEPTRAEPPIPIPSTIHFGSQPSHPPPPASGGGGTEGKKKRGRPRKYGPDGKLTTALSPTPISAAVPISRDYSSPSPASWKRGSRGRGLHSVKKQHRTQYETLGKKLKLTLKLFLNLNCLILIQGNGVAYSVGANFTPHVISVNAGEDVMMKIMSFSQQSARAICILSANGTISNVTLRQPTSSGGTLTYEGRFEILSLSGSFMPTDVGGTKIRSGGMSVSLAGPDGRVVGGGLAGLLIAAGPVQAVVGSFLPGHQMEQMKQMKHKKHRFEQPPPIIAAAPPALPPPVTLVSARELKEASAEVKPAAASIHEETNPPPPPSFNNTVHQMFRNSSSENRSSEDEDEDDDDDDDNDSRDRDGSSPHCELSF
ncbi:AT-hook motif nuclear-localized protein 3 [Linum perenne]